MYPIIYGFDINVGWEASFVIQNFKTLRFLNCANKCDQNQFFTITNHIKEENVDDDDESGKEMVALRNRFKNLLRHEHVIDKKNDEEEEDDDDDHEMSLANATGKFSVLFAASQLLYGTLCREAPNERIIYNNRSSNEIEDVKEGEEELDDRDDFVAQPEEEEEETNEKEEEEAEKDTNQKDKWKELIQAFEMQRKRDELETKLNELEHEGVTLEKSIQDDDNDDENEMSLPSATTPTTTAREKLSHLIAMVRLKNKMQNILDKINTR